MVLKSAIFMISLFAFSTAYADFSNYDADKWYRDSAEHTAIYREIYLMSEKNVRFLAIIQGKSPSTLPAQKIVAWFGDIFKIFQN